MGTRGKGYTKRHGLRTVATALPIPEAVALKEWARVFGRSLDEELKLAVRLHLHGHALAHLKREDGRENVRASGYDPDEELAVVKESLAELTQRSFSTPPAVMVDPAAVARGTAP